MSGEATGYTIQRKADSAWPATALASNQFRRQRTLLDMAPDFTLLPIRLEGPAFPGKDNEGRRFETRPPEYLRMELSGASVWIRYGKSCGFNSGNGTNAVVETDVFKGVRGLAGVLEESATSLKMRTAFLWDAECLNFLLANSGKIDDPEVLEVEGRIRETLLSARLQQASAGNGSGETLRNALRALAEARETGGYSERNALITQACSGLVAFGKRVGWMMEEEHISALAYNFHRAGSLRAARDWVLKESFLSWKRMVGRYTHDIMKIWTNDLENAERLGGLIAAGGPGLAWKIRKSAENLGTAGQEGVARARLSRAAALLDAGEKESAFREMRATKRNIEVRNPIYVAGQLEKTGDSYTDIIVARMNTATKLLSEGGHFRKSAELFVEAGQML